MTWWFHSTRLGPLVYRLEFTDGLHCVCASKSRSAVQHGADCLCIAQGTTLLSNTATLSTFGTTGCSAGNMLFSSSGWMGPPLRAETRPRMRFASN
jgi:hypothetical protein